MSKVEKVFPVLTFTHIHHMSLNIILSNLTDITDFIEVVQKRYYEITELKIVFPDYISSVNIFGIEWHKKLYILIPIVEKCFNLQKLTIDGYNSVYWRNLLSHCVCEPRCGDWITLLTSSISYFHNRNLLELNISNLDIALCSNCDTVPYQFVIPNVRNIKIEFTTKNGVYIPKYERVNETFSSYITTSNIIKDSVLENFVMTIKGQKYEYIPKNNPVLREHQISRIMEELMWKKSHSILFINGFVYGGPTSKFFKYHFNFVNSAVITSFLT